MVSNLTIKEQNMSIVVWSIIVICICIMAIFQYFNLMDRLLYVDNIFYFWLIILHIYWALSMSANLLRYVKR